MDIDFLLLQRMKRGDENAFDVFVRKYYKEILNYCKAYEQTIQNVGGIDYLLLGLGRAGNIGINIATVIVAFFGPLVNPTTIWSLASALCGLHFLVQYF